MAMKAMNGVLDKVVVSYLGSALDKIPLKYKTLIGCLLTSAAYAATGVFSHFSFDDGWNQGVIQAVLDWSKMGGEVLIAAGAAHKLVKALPPQQTVSGKPEVDRVSTTMTPMGE